METKYIKVPVSERLPKYDKVYVCIWLDCNMCDIIDKSRYFMGSENHRFFSHAQPVFWLEEVPDREDEMIDMLEKVCTELYKSDNLMATEARQLLNSIKQ